MRKRYLWLSGCLILLGSTISLLLSRSGFAEDSKYIGVNKCKMCHMKEYKAWQETKHAKAFESLVKADDKSVAEIAAKLGISAKGKADSISECVICHVTGYKLSGGYVEAGENLDNLKNVTCEVCHGAGSVHFTAKKEDKKKTMSTKPDEKVCKTCHTEKTSPNFKFDEYLKKGVHQVK